MIIKSGEDLDWEAFVTRDGKIRAKRINEDFYAETSVGWQEGKKGDWIMDLGNGLRMICSNEVFAKNYVLVCQNAGDCPQRRSSDRS